MAEVTWHDHDHRGEYAADRHDHDLEYAEKHHRHYDDESTARGLREDLGRAEERIRDLEDRLAALLMALRRRQAFYDELLRTSLADQPYPAIAEELSETLAAVIGALDEREGVEITGGQL